MSSLGSKGTFDDEVSAEIIENELNTSFEVVDIEQDFVFVDHPEEDVTASFELMIAENYEEAKKAIVDATDKFLKITLNDNNRSNSEEESSKTDKKEQVDKPDVCTKDKSNASESISKESKVNKSDFYSKETSDITDSASDEEHSTRDSCDIIIEDMLGIRPIVETSSIKDVKFKGPARFTIGDSSPTKFSHLKGPRPKYSPTELSKRMREYRPSKREASKFRAPIVLDLSAYVNGPDEESSDVPSNSLSSTTSSSVQPSKQDNQENNF